MLPLRCEAEGNPSNRTNEPAPVPNQPARRTTHGKYCWSTSCRSSRTGASPTAFFAKRAAKSERRIRDDPLHPCWHRRRQVVNTAAATFPPVVGDIGAHHLMTGCEKRPGDGAIAGSR